MTMTNPTLKVPRSAALVLAPLLRDIAEHTESKAERHVVNAVAKTFETLGHRADTSYVFSDVERAVAVYCTRGALYQPRKIRKRREREQLQQILDLLEPRNDPYAVTTDELDENGTEHIDETRVKSPEKTGDTGVTHHVMLHPTEAERLANSLVYWQKNYVDDLTRYRASNIYPERIVQKLRMLTRDKVSHSPVTFDTPYLVTFEAILKQLVQELDTDWSRVTKKTLKGRPDGLSPKEETTLRHIAPLVGKRVAAV